MTAEARRQAYVAAAFRAASDGIAPAEVDRVCRDAGKLPAAFNHLVERITARKQAVADLEQAAAMEAEREAVAAKLEGQVAAIAEAVAGLEQLRLGQLTILAEVNAVSKRQNELRSHATAVLQATSGDAAEWDDVRNVRIDDRPPEVPRMLSQETTHAFRPGNSAILPSSTFVPSRG